MIVKGVVGTKGELLPPGTGKPKIQKEGASFSQIITPLLIFSSIPLIPLLLQNPLVFIIPLAFGIATGIVICIDNFSDLDELIQGIKERIRYRNIWDTWLETSWILVVVGLAWFMAVIVTGLATRNFSTGPQGFEVFNRDSSTGSLMFGVFNLGFFLGLALGAAKNFWQSKSKQFFINRELAARRKEARQACEQENLEVLIKLLGDDRIQDYVARLLARISEASQTELIRVLKDYERVDDYAGRHQIVGAAKALRQMDGVPADQVQEAYLLIAEGLWCHDWQSLVDLGEPALDPLRELLQGLPEKILVEMTDYDGFGRTDVESDNPEYSDVDKAISQIYSNQNAQAAGAEEPGSGGTGSGGEDKDEPHGLEPGKQGTVQDKL